MVKLIEQVWRLVRVGGVGVAARAVVDSGHLAADVKLVVAALSTAAVETAYRQIVPARDQSRLAKFFAAVKVAYTDAEKQVGSAKVTV